MRVVLLQQVNGMDIIAARHAVQYARKWVTGGNGPLLMEFVTYRYGGHSYAASSPFAIIIISYAIFFLSFYTGCRTLELHTGPARKSKGCEAPRTLLEVCSAISRNGVW